MIRKWMSALIQARYELHLGPDKWETWNEVEDFFGLWLQEIEWDS